MCGLEHQRVIPVHVELCHVDIASVLASKKPTVHWLCRSIHKCQTGAGWVATDGNRVLLREIGPYGFNRFNPVLKPRAIRRWANIQNPSKKRLPFIPLVDVFRCVFPSATFSFSAPCRGLTLGNQPVHCVHQSRDVITDVFG
jgi:hypothetical protein